MKPIIDMSGKRFERLLVLRISDQNPRYWVCKCDCGAIKEVCGYRMRLGTTRSCGCLGIENRKKHAKTASVTHGQYLSGAYRSWTAMISRCAYPKNASYKDYGGAGISVCERWMKFESFHEDMGDRPEGATLDRYPDGGGNYEPGNCRWATPLQQTNNQQRTRRVAYRGVEYTLRELSEATGVSLTLLRNRMRRKGISVEELVERPAPIRVSEETATGIRESLGKGESQKKIAARFGVSQTIVSDIYLGRWKTANDLTKILGA